MFYFNLRRSILLVIILLFIFSLVPISASALDQRCFTKTECEKVRKDFGLSDQEAKEGFYRGGDAVSICKNVNAQGKELGFCLPVTQTETTVKFGGKTKFAHWGEFIQYMYRYAIIIAGILAVIVIMFAGFQWATAGGNSEAISSARKRISGAMIGLFLAIMSYLVLNLVNPYLVNLRLPQIWLINPRALVLPMCSALDKGAKIALAFKQGEKVSTEDREKKFQGINDFTGKDSLQANCGDEYFVEGGGGQTCIGTMCSKGNFCFKKINETQYNCQEGTIGGKAFGGLGEYLGLASTNIADLFTGREVWAWKWIEEVEVWTVCQDGTHFEADSSDIIDPDDMYDESKLEQTYVNLVEESQIESAESKCEAHNNIKGFILRVDMNEAQEFMADEDHFVGNSGGLGVDLGDASNSYAEELLKIAPLNYFMPPSAMKEGVVLDIDVSQIFDIDDNWSGAQAEQERQKYYGHLGYKAHK